MEVSQWMKALIEEDSSPHMPFLATKGYDSVVWNRLYSRDISELEDYQINQASIPTKMFYTYLLSGTKLLVHQQINAILKETLQAVGAKAMVVGHTPQYSGANWYADFVENVF